MADSIIQPMRFTIDLDSALVTQTGCGQLIYGDKSANVIEVKVQRGGKAIDLTGMTATGAFYRPVDGAEVPLPGAISANVVGVQLIDECYETEGHYEAEVKLSQGEVRRTILSIVGYVHRAGSGAVVNVTGVMPSIPELLAQISAMEAAAERANTAAARAEALAIDANGYAQNAKQLNGKNASEYALKTDLPTKASDIGALPSDGTAVNATQLNGKNASEYALKTDTAPDSAKLGGVEASEYAKKTDIPENTGGDADTLGGKAPAFYTPYENRADNSDFRHWIAQAGIGGKHGTQSYGGDRWILVSGTITGEENANGNGFENIILNGTIRQIVANPEETMTAFVKTISGTATATYSSGTLTITSNGGVLDWVMLIPGALETQPPYVPKENELAACLRYFRKLGPAPSEFMVLSGHVTSGGTTILVGLPFVLDMRVKPTLTASCSLQIRGIAGYATEATASSTLTDAVFTLMPTTDGKVALMSIKKADGTAFGNITNNTPVSVQFQGASVLEFSADL